MTFKRSAKSIQSMLEQGADHNLAMFNPKTIHVPIRLIPFYTWFELYLIHMTQHSYHFETTVNPFPVPAQIARMQKWNQDRNLFSLKAEKQKAFLFDE